MPTLRIPGPVREGLGKLARLSNEDFDSISTGIATVPPKLKPIEIARSIQDSVPQITAKDLQDILEAVGSMLASGTAQEEVPFERFISDVMDAMQRSDVTPPASGWDGLRGRITSLVSAKVLRMSSRADDIQHEQTNNFTAVRILTDVRSVFNEEGTEAQGALIIHQLKLTYFSSGEYFDIYIAMDNADLRSLRNAVDRAERKTGVVKSFLKKASLTYLESAETN